jgi:hypothetical protein
MKIVGILQPRTWELLILKAARPLVTRSAPRYAADSDIRGGELRNAVPGLPCT